MNRKLQLLSMTLASLLLFADPSKAGLKIFFVRHVEGGHNVMEQWADKPKETWPSYVGHSDRVTPKGEQQRLDLVERLKPYHFDFIAASPYWRTQNTILPYMKAMNLKGEVWPELGELPSRFGNWETVSRKPDLPAPSANLFESGKPIVIKEAESPYFTLREGAAKEFNVHSDNPVQLAVNEHAVVTRLLEMIKRRFGGSDKTILLVGHGYNGVQLIKEITCYSVLPAVDIVNAGIWMAEEQPDGTFKLKTFNNEPYVEPAKNIPSAATPVPAAAAMALSPR